MIQETVKSQGQKIMWPGSYLAQETSCLLERQKVQAMPLP